MFDIHRQSLFEENVRTSKQMLTFPGRNWVRTSCFLPFVYLSDYFHKWRDKNLTENRFEIHFYFFLFKLSVYKNTIMIKIKITFEIKEMKEISFCIENVLIITAYLFSSFSLSFFTDLPCELKVCLTNMKVAKLIQFLLPLPVWRRVMTAPLARCSHACINPSTARFTCNIL